MMTPSKAKYTFDPTIHPHFITDENGAVFCSGHDLNTLVDSLSWAIACGHAHVKDVPGSLAHLVRGRLVAIKDIRSLMMLFADYFTDNHHDAISNRRRVGDRPVPDFWFEPSEDWEGRYSRCVMAITDLGYIIDPKDDDALKLYADLFWGVVKDEHRLDIVNPDTWARAVPNVQHLYYFLMDQYNRGCYEPKDPDIEAKGATLARMADLLGIDPDYRPVTPYGKPTKKS